MANFTKMKLWLLTMLLVVGSGVAWGQAETLTCTIGSISSNTMTFNTTNFTFVHSKGTDANFAAFSPWRVYTGNTVSITGGSGVSTINSIVINASTAAYATAISATGSSILVTGGGTASTSVSGNNCTITISGTASAITIKPSAQTRWNSIVVNYTSNSSCSSLATPTVTPSAGNTEATLSWNAVANATSYTLIWNGGSPETVTSPVTKTGLTNGTSYSYSVMAVGDGTTYCATNTAATGNVTPVAPPKPEPTNHASTISASTNSHNQITLTWTDAIGAQIPDGYLIKASTGTPSTPVDGTDETQGTLIKKINQGIQSVVFTGLTASTTYNFSIWPYTNSGNQIDYKTDGTVPTASAETAEQPWLEDFEAGTKASYATGNVTATMGEWTLTDALIGTLADDKKNGAKSVRVRNSGIASMNFDKSNGAGTVSVYHAKYGTDADGSWKLQISTNGGLNWADVGATVSTTSTTLTEETFTVNQSGNVRFQIVKLTGNRINIDDISITDYTGSPSEPAITVSTNSLTGFTYAHGSGPSIEQSFTIGGVNLTNNISIAASANYEISKTSGSGYASPLTFTPGEAATPQTVYVRLKSGLTLGNFNDEVINITSTGADAKTVTVSGSVTAAINPEPSAHVTGFGAVEDGQNAITVNWTDAAGADGYLIKASTTSFEAIAAPVDGTPESDGTLVKNVVQGEGTVEFTGLAAGTTYYFKIWPYSNSGASIDYKTDGSVPEASATTVAPVSGLQLSNVNTKYTIDFDNTVNNVNNGQFVGTGFTPIPEVGQLNSYSWAMTGMSEGSLAFGQIRTSSDFTGGISTGNVTSGGTYAFAVSEGNNALGFQPTGNDWAPGTVTLKLQNKTGAAINTLSVAYNVYIRNDQGRSSSFGFSHSEDDNNYTNIPTLMLISDEAADDSPTWKKYYRSAELTGLNIPNDAYYYIRWSSADVAGSGSRDEFALDDIQLIANPTSVKPEISGVVEDLIVEGDLEIATSLTVNNKLTVTGNLTNNGTLTLKSDVNGTATLLNTGTVSTGSYVVEQHLAASRNWYVASPVSNANALGAGFEYWQYNEPDGSSATENWTVVSASTPLVPGRGYVVKPSGETTYAFSTTTGTLNTGNVTVPLTRTVGVTKEGFNLVGNPYPSYLNLNDLLTGDIETSYWMRGRNSGNTAWVFDSFNKEGNVGTNNSGKAVTTYVPPMQSFWVRVKTGVASTNLVFDNTMRAHIDEPTNRFRAPQNTPLIRLEMSNGTAADQTVLYANGNAVDAVDKYDTHKMLNNSTFVPDIYSVVGNQKLALNGLSAMPLNIEMPLGILVKEAGNFSIRVSEMRAIDADIVLIDKLNGNAEWLLNGGTAYQFASSTTTHAERFALVLRAPGTTTGECCNDILGAQTMVFVDAFRNINISCAMAVNKNAKVAVYNSVGQMLTQRNLENGSASIAVTSKGVYLVELNVDGLRTTKRVIVK